MQPSLFCKGSNLSWLIWREGNSCHDIPTPLEVLFMQSSQMKVLCTNLFYRLYFLESFMTWPDLVIVPVGVLSLDCVLCVGLYVTSDGVLMLVCVCWVFQQVVCLEYWGVGGGSVLCEDILWRGIIKIVDIFLEMPMVSVKNLSCWSFNDVGAWFSAGLSDNCWSPLSCIMVFYTNQLFCV